MDEAILKSSIANLSIWKKNGQRAPHKPLLILYALAQLQNKNLEQLPYAQVKVDLTHLLKEYGPARSAYTPEQPFVRLARDGIWQCSRPTDQLHVHSGFLLRENIAGGFTPEVLQLLQRNERLVSEIVVSLLHDHFPATLHEDILNTLGLIIYDEQLTDHAKISTTKKRERSPYFRERVMRAYEYRCAVCGFGVRMGQSVIALEAAHIKWHQAGGPDEEVNGIALCSMHHKLFDHGAFTLQDNKMFVVSEEANGAEHSGYAEWLGRFHGTNVRAPISPEYEPHVTFLQWHVREVFKGRARYLHRA